MGDELLVAMPEWTEFKKKTGLDPLGMQNSSVRLYQSLVPGISNVTLRVRYYGLYAWLSQSYARTIGDTDMRKWQQFIRRAEALYALVAVVRGGENGVAGALWAGRKVAESQGRAIAFGDDAEPGSPTHYLKQAWGAYGAAYASQLFEIGVFSHGSGHAIPVPSKEIGEALAEAFTKAVGEEGPRFLQVMEQGVASHEDLERLAVMAPSEISRSSQERNLYERILFAETGLNRDRDISRRHTLLLVLHLSQLAQKEPSVDTVRWALYSKRLAGIGWELPAQLMIHRDKWCLYQANDLSHIAFESILKFILDRLGAHPAGLPLAQLISQAAADVLSAMKDAPANWTEFTEALVYAPDASSALDPLSEWTLASSLIETMRRGRLYTVETCVTALRLLGLVHKRTEALTDLVNAEFGILNPHGFRSLLTERNFLEANAELNMTQLLVRMFEERIVRRHLWVALRKLRPSSAVNAEI